MTLNGRTLSVLPRKLQRVLKAENSDRVMYFINSVRNYNPSGKILPDRLRWYAARIFEEHGLGPYPISFEEKLGLADRNYILVQAILQYMWVEGLVKVKSGHYYWPEHDVERFKKRRYAPTGNKKRKPKVEMDLNYVDPYKDEETPDEQENDGEPVMGLKIRVPEDQKPRHLQADYEPPPEEPEEIQKIVPGFLDTVKR